MNSKKKKGLGQQSETEDMQRLSTDGLLPALAYLDWNVFNKIESGKLSTPEDGDIYRKIEALILSGQILTPYSNAHMSDLHRGYIKNPDFIEGHLATLETLTNNLCLTQYWNEPKTRYHYRDVRSYFEDIRTEAAVMPTEFQDLFDSADSDHWQLAASSIFKMQCLQMKLLPVPLNFKEIYNAEPIFHTLFPRTKIGMNMLALNQDIYAMHTRLATDFALYKSFRKYLVQTRLKYPQLPRISKLGGYDLTTQSPASLSWDEALEEYAPKQKPSANVSYDKIIDLFTKTDIAGYRPDERFANLMDDAMHTFYGAHCMYFVTLDARCYDKAKKVFSKLNITTRVMTPEEFVACFTKMQL